MNTKNLDKHIPTLISLWRKNGEKKTLNQSEIKVLSQSLLNLQRGLTGERKLAGQSYMNDKNLFGAYLLYYFPVSYLQIQTVVESFETAENTAISTNSNNNCIKILEIGSGPAPGTIAICDKIKEKNPNAKIEITLLDSSKNALETAKKIIQSDFKNVEIKTEVCNLENKSVIETLNHQNFSIILMSHVLNELWKTDNKKIEKRINFLKNVKNFLSESGILILNEPAVLESSRNLIKVRDEILNDKEFEELNLIGPCQNVISDFENKKTGKELNQPIQCPCLLSENQTCHAEKMWKPNEPILSLAKGAKLDRQSVKMTYFVFSKMKKENGKQKNDFSNSQFSICSDSMLNKSGRVRFMLCDGKKRFSISAKKDDEHAKKIGFFNLKRYDRIQIENPEIREENFGIKNETNLLKLEF